MQLPFSESDLLFIFAAATGKTNRFCPASTVFFFVIDDSEMLHPKGCDNKQNKKPKTKWKPVGPKK